MQSAISTATKFLKQRQGGKKVHTVGDYAGK
jgi:hypothetical protein